MKKLRYLKSKISKKFHCLLFLFYFFSIFGIFFSISPIQTCPKIMEFFVVFYIERVRDFTNDLWKILKVLFKKILICEILFFKILSFTICFLFFYYFWLFNFNFIYLYLWKSSINFYVFLFYGLEILSKNFGKSWNIFLKNIYVWNPKFFINSIIYYLFSFCIFLTFW